MKKCAYCGRENAMEAEYCHECGTAEFVVPDSPASRSREGVERVAEIVEPDSDVALDGEAALCISCVFPNLPDGKWCKRCGAPMSPLVMFLMPDAAQAAGFVYRRAVEARPKLVVVCGIWIQFFPGLVVNALVLWSILVAEVRGLPGFASFFLALIGVVVCGSMVYRVTRNYLKMQKSDSPEVAV